MWPKYPIGQFRIYTINVTCSCCFCCKFCIYTVAQLSLQHIAFVLELDNYNITLYNVCMHTNPVDSIVLNICIITILLGLCRVKNKMNLCNEWLFKNCTMGEWDLKLPHKPIMRDKKSLIKSQATGISN